MNNPSPPKWPLKFFRWFCDPDYAEDIEGDLLERFEKQPSSWRFALEIFLLIRLSLMKPTNGGKLNYYGMFKHHLKVSLRSLTRQRSISFINIGGLALGLLASLMIVLWVQDERSWDKDNEHYERVSRLRQKRIYNGEYHMGLALPYPLAAELRDNYNNFFDHVVLSNWFGDYLIGREENGVNIRGAFMETEAPEVMSLKMVSGSREGLAEEAAIFLSKSAAQSLFGDENPINQSVKIHNHLTMIVRGVYEDLPHNNSFHQVKFVGSWDFYVSSQDWMREKIKRASWEDNSFQIFAMISEHASIDEVNNKIAKLINDRLPLSEQSETNAVFLNPMKDWHLRSSWVNGVQSGGDIMYVRWFSLIGFLVLFLACINFMNLSTAQSVRRAKEVGIRKSIGSIRSQLVTQFLTESTLFVFISFLITTGLSILILPYFNELTGKQLSIPIGSWVYWKIGLVFVLIVGVLAGSYPAFYLSSFRPIQVLKGAFQSRLSATLLRKTMIVFQFTISIALIIGTIVISRQISYSVNRPLGYTSDGTISIEMSSAEYYKKKGIIEKELVRTGAISHFAESTAPLTEVWSMVNDLEWIGKDPAFKPVLNVLYVSPNFGETINWDIAHGRDFDHELSLDSTAVILNETAASIMGLTNPVGKDLKWNGTDHRVIGIVKDLLIESPFRKVEPSIYLFSPGGRGYANFSLIKLNDQLTQKEAIMKVAEVYEEVLPNIPFEFEFVSDIHHRKFRSIRKVGSLINIFSSFAIIISCLGLFGLAAFMVEQRTKEIGIRKVLGASVLRLWRLVSQEFIVLVLIASIVAIPLAFWVLKNWLAGYEYRIDLEWWFFAIATIGSLLLTIATVSLKSLGVARLNPAKTLKDE